MPNHREGLQTNPGKPEARSSDAARHRDSEEAETQRLMSNWALWRSGSGVSAPTSSVFDLEARGRREAMSVPLINGEAADVDAAVDALPPELRQVVYVHWLQQINDKRGRPRKWEHANEQQRARACACEIRTYYRRLAHAHERIRTLMRAKKTQAERARALYRARGSLDKYPVK